MVDEHVHVYELDLAELILELARELAPRGYRVERSDRDVLRFETYWRRGPAYGEIGSLLYTLVAQRLREIEA